MANDQDYLAQKSVRKRLTARDKLLRSNRAREPLPPNVEILEGVGGTTVYRVKFGGFSNNQSSR